MTRPPPPPGPGGRGRPWNRCAPYLWGVLAALGLQRLKQHRAAQLTAATLQYAAAADLDVRGGGGEMGPEVGGGRGSHVGTTWSCPDIVESPQLIG